VRLPLSFRSTFVPALLFLMPMAASAQKVEVQPRVLDRLPAPRSITVRQMGPTRVWVTWGAVEGAKSYVLGRSVGTEGFRRVIDASSGPDTVYVDDQARPGLSHTYTVTAVSQSDVAGIRGTSEKIVVSPMPGGATTPVPTTPIPMTVTANRVAANAIAFSWNSPGPNTLYYAVTHWLNGQVLLNIPRLDAPSITRSDLPPGQHRLQINAQGRDGSSMGVAQSATIDIAAAPTPATIASDATPAAVLVAMAAPATVRVGGTTSLGAGQWTSLNTGVATVSIDGTVTGRAGGTAQVVSLGSTSDGTVRVTVVRVTVQP
jgi:hypothetical protein